MGGHWIGGRRAAGGGRMGRRAIGRRRAGAGGERRAMFDRAVGARRWLMLKFKNYIHTCSSRRARWGQRRTRISGDLKGDARISPARAQAFIVQWRVGLRQLFSGKLVSGSSIARKTAMDAQAELPVGAPRQERWG